MKQMTLPWTRATRKPPTLGHDEEAREARIILDPATIREVVLLMERVLVALVRPGREEDHER